MEDCENGFCVCKRNGDGQCFESTCSGDGDCPVNFLCSENGRCECHDPHTMMGELCLDTSDGYFHGMNKDE